jgi:L-threonylcarbamoyladenylate synthase
VRTEVLTIHPNEPEPERIVRAAAALRAGGLVAFPTETVYGLGANAWNAAAVEAIFTAKGRPATNPLIVHVPDVAGARAVVAHWPLEAERLAQRFWPGPLTLVLPKAESVPLVVTAGGMTVAVRAPAHPVAQALLQASGLPIAAPSANRSNRLSPTRAEHVLRDLEGRIPLLLDGGPTSGGIESTVLDVTTQPAQLLRPGLITVGELEAVIGPITGPAAGSTKGPLPSPGMLARHYAPRTPLEVMTVAPESRVDNLLSAGQRVGWVTFAERASRPGLVTVVMPNDPAGYAARLYAVLHELDQAGLDRIVVEAPPETDAWLGVRDRLRRAGE